MVYEKMANSRNQGHVIFRVGKFEKYIWSQCGDVWVVRMSEWLPPLNNVQYDIDYIK